MTNFTNNDIDRIKKAKNRVFFTGGFGIGRNNPNSLSTTSLSVYRVTGMNQIADIINCGYIRPKVGLIKGGHKNEVFWSLGGEKTFYYDKRPVLETEAKNVTNGQIGALSINDLNAIWIFDESQNKYINKIDIILKIYEFVKNNNYQIDENNLILLKNYLEQNYTEIKNFNIK